MKHAERIEGVDIPRQVLSGCGLNPFDGFRSKLSEIIERAFARNYSVFKEVVQFLIPDLSPRIFLGIFHNFSGGNSLVASAPNPFPREVNRHVLHPVRAGKRLRGVRAGPRVRIFPSLFDESLHLRAQPLGAGSASRALRRVFEQLHISAPRLRVVFGGIVKDAPVRFHRQYRIDFPPVGERRRRPPPPRVGKRRGVGIVINSAGSRQYCGLARSSHEVSVRPVNEVVRPRTSAGLSELQPPLPCSPAGFSLSELQPPLSSGFRRIPNSRAARALRLPSGFGGGVSSKGLRRVFRSGGRIPFVSARFHPFDCPPRARLRHNAKQRHAVHRGRCILKFFGSGLRHFSGVKLLAARALLCALHHRGLRGLNRAFGGSRGGNVHSGFRGIVEDFVLNPLVRDFVNYPAQAPASQRQARDGRQSPPRVFQRPVWNREPVSPSGGSRVVKAFVAQRRVNVRQRHLAALGCHGSLVPEQPSGNPRRNRAGSPRRGSYPRADSRGRQSGGGGLNIHVHKERHKPRRPRRNIPQERLVFGSGIFLSPLAVVLIEFLAPRRGRLCAFAGLQRIDVVYERRSQIAPPSVRVKISRPPCLGNIPQIVNYL